jgi:uncharacterized protein (DUF1778 family)
LRRTAADTSETVSFRVSPAEKQLLEVVAEHEGERPSPFARQVVFRVLAEIVRREGGIEKIIAANLTKRRKAEETQAADLAILLQQLTLVTDAE